MVKAEEVDSPSSVFLACNATHCGCRLPPGPMEPFMRDLGARELNASVLILMMLAIPLFLTHEIGTGLFIGLYT